MSSLLLQAEDLAFQGLHATVACTDCVLDSAGDRDCERVEHRRRRRRAETVEQETLERRLTVVGAV